MLKAINNFSKMACSLPLERKRAIYKMTKQKRIDLHTHSTASDGIYSPEQLIQIASLAGIAALGLTDHDSVAGLTEAIAAADNYGVELVPGVEISILEDKREIHILGYYPQDIDRLHAELEDIREERHSRMKKIVDKLIQQGFKINLNEVLVEAGQSAPGRLHLARLLVKKKYVHTLDEAFKLYLNPDQVAYVPRRLMTLKRAMQLLSSVGAIIVIAHPGIMGKIIIDRLLPLGLQGIEVFHPDHSAVQKKLYLHLAQLHGLLITGGSDFHGDRERTTGYPRHLAISGSYLNNLKITAGI